MPHLSPRDSYSLGDEEISNSAHEEKADSAVWAQGTSDGFLE